MAKWGTAVGQTVGPEPATRTMTDTTLRDRIAANPRLAGVLLAALALLAQAGSAAASGVAVIFGP